MLSVSLPLVSAASLVTIDVAALRAALESTVKGEVRFGRLDRAIYSTDASIYQIVPLGVVLPRDEADVLATLRLCARFGVPLTARGGGTSQAGQSIGSGIVLDFSKYLDQILDWNAEERWVRVQPGCVLDDLNARLKPAGLHFAPDISTSNRATIGGMIANNSSGTRSIVYGKTGDHVLELKVALADGSVVLLHSLDEVELAAKWLQKDLEGDCYRTAQRLGKQHSDEIDRRFPKILRRVGGYDLPAFLPGKKTYDLGKLFVGSEGTLGILLEAKLRLVELPTSRVLLVVQFADLLEALSAAPTILTHCPSAMEVVDRYVLDSTRLNPEANRLRDFLQGDPGAILIIEFSGFVAADLLQRLDALEAELRSHNLGLHLHRAIEPAAQARIWKLRKAALGLSMAEKGDAKAISFVEDTAVAPERLRDYIAEFLTLLARHGAKSGIYAHASVGCLHVRPVIDLKTEEGVQRFETIAAEVAALVLKYGGALSGEHGDGLVRSPFQEKMYGPVLYQAFRDLKRTFDPRGLLNPGKIVDAPPLAANLRFGPAYVTPEIETTFDFSVDGGLTRAAELCAGVGECRKKRDGTMCPSYQATRDERHSTRGRANALRLALTGQFGNAGLSDPLLHEALDLCLECKACKSECPTNTDMARLKAEFLHQYHRSHGLPWRSRIFGNIGAFSAWGIRMPTLANWLMAQRGVRWLNEKLLGIDRRRLPPRFSSAGSFVDGYLKAISALHSAGGSGSSEALLFPDTFTNYYEPEIASATLELFARCDCRLIPGIPAGTDARIQLRTDVPANLRCCGRPFISNGMLDQAVENARRNVESLYPWASAGKPILACEPSCILTIKDDYPALLRGELRRQAEVVARACRTFEEQFDELLARSDSNPLMFAVGPKRILVQGHCHQKALVGMAPTLRLLRRIPEAEIVDLDTGCCGMAGSFGYEAEHYEVSRLVGEQRLFPALRQSEAETTVVAAGLSCRLQIQHFTDRTAIHPALLLQSLLRKPGHG